MNPPAPALRLVWGSYVAERTIRVHWTWHSDVYPAYVSGGFPKYDLPDEQSGDVEIKQITTGILNAEQVTAADSANSILWKGTIMLGFVERSKAPSQSAYTEFREDGQQYDVILRASGGQAVAKNQQDFGVLTPSGPQDHGGLVVPLKAILDTVQPPI